MKAAITSTFLDSVCRQSPGAVGGFSSTSYLRSMACLGRNSGSVSLSRDFTTAIHCCARYRTHSGQPNTYYR